MSEQDHGRNGSGRRDDATASVAPSSQNTSRQIGPYKLLQRIGEGGMGEVWLAEQTEPVRRRVAVKIVKRGMDTERVIARFEAERQALAVMDHPAVARVLDAGSTREGRPYFVMEYIQGEPIIEYCDRHRLSIRERLRLFQQVCAGVQHAHQKGIIHRDLKPSNVLVTAVGSAAQPKVIDFGVAKATQQKLTERTLFTELGVMIGTPEYMSPEQAEATGLDVDTRTDVYTLGVMLYELLSGALPFEPADLRLAGLDAIRRKIREEEPSRPSERMSTLGDQSSEVARRRATDPGRLVNTLKGDLDWITMRALEKDRTRRYGSPSELASDIERHLRDEPVQARPQSGAYKAKKFLRRHKPGVAVAALGIAALVTFAGAMGWQARRIALERDRAEWASRFLMSIFLSPDPSEALGGEVTARELLDRGAARVEVELSGEPVLQSQVMTMLGRTYDGLGLYEEAERLLERAMTMQEEELGPTNQYTVASMHNLALVYLELGRYADAEALYREAIARERRGVGEMDPLTLTSMANLANTLSSLGQYAEAESLHTRVLELRRRVRGPDHLETLSSVVDRALVWEEQGRYDEAERDIRGALGVMGQRLREDHPLTLKAKHNLALMLNRQGRYAEAETLYIEALEGMRRVLGEDHPNTLTCMTALAMARANQGRFDEAEALLRETLEIQRRVMDETRPEVLDTVYNLGCLAALEGDRIGALTWLEQAVERGYIEANWMLRDPDLESLQGDPEFEAIVELARENAVDRQARALPGVP